MFFFVFVISNRTQSTVGCTSRYISRYFVQMEVHRNDTGLHASAVLSTFAASLYYFAVPFQYHIGHYSWYICVIPFVP